MDVPRSFVSGFSSVWSGSNCETGADGTRKGRRASEGGAAGCIEERRGHRQSDDDARTRGARFLNVKTHELLLLL